MTPLRTYKGIFLTGRNTNPSQHVGKQGIFQPFWYLFSWHYGVLTHVRASQYLSKNLKELLWSCSIFLYISPLFRSHVADRVLVLWPGVRPVPLRLESPVQDMGPPETSYLHVISNSESSPRDLHLNTKTQLHSTTSKLQCWTPYAKQLARQEHKPTH